MTTKPIPPDFRALKNTGAQRSQPWRVMLVDDHPVVRHGLAELIQAEANLLVCAQASDPVEAMGLLPAAHPDLVITDITMPGRGGIELIKDIWAFDSHIKVLVLTMREEAHYAERALHAGASGYLMKGAGREAILSAIYRVLEGGVALSPDLSNTLIRRVTGPAGRGNHSLIGSLTDRELEVFQLIGRGQDTAEIAAQLRLSRKTVDVHRANIKRKLGLPNATALIRCAVQWLEHESGSLRHQHL